MLDVYITTSSPQNCDEVQYEVLARTIGGSMWYQQGKWYQKDTAIRQAETLGHGATEALVMAHKVMTYPYMETRHGVTKKW